MGECMVGFCWGARDELCTAVDFLHMFGTGPDVLDARCLQRRVRNG